MCLDQFFIYPLDLAIDSSHHLGRAVIKSMVSITCHMSLRHSQTQTWLNLACKQYYTAYSMVEENTFSYMCRRSFTHEFAYGKHQRSCQKTKKRLSEVLDRAKELWLSRKQQKHYTHAPEPLLEDHIEMDHGVMSNDMRDTRSHPSSARVCSILVMAVQLI
jgi:hypothetical protein